VAPGSEIDLLVGNVDKVVDLCGVPFFTDKGDMNRVQKRGSLSWFGRREQFEIMRSVKSMASPSARFQGVPGLSIPDDRSTTASMAYVDVMVGANGEDQG
jgi:hypothetical protein